ncbi:SDR family oxidoreductase [Burkholderia sp. BCC0405]|uniref:SDR family NAD(P)-dependent oxidoreductase n=1 Tax=Burkholderia sp. BCC0405 TaxID=2676298 RepID=UPI001588E00A|nr:SDR family oxidoreductase [Burkholderia sp. BCC0405]
MSTYSSPDCPDPRRAFADRRVLITGASLGIGREVARRFALAGAEVAIHHSKQIDELTGHANAAGALAGDLQADGAKLHVLDVDLAVPGSGMTLANHALDVLGQVDIVVLCASMQIREDFAAISPASIQKHARVNFEASIELLQALLPGMSGRGWGRVIAIGSLNQTRPDPQLAVYAALKAAHHNLMANLAKVHAPNGVTVNTISPGLIATPRNAWRRENAAEWAAIEHGANPMHRSGHPHEVAEMVLVLASPAGSFITGTNIPIDGGAHL